MSQGALHAAGVTRSTPYFNAYARQLLLGALGGGFQLLLSVPLILEYEAVLKRPTVKAWP